MPVIDASCYIALINADEPAHAETQLWFQQTVMTGLQISAPSILLAEVAAALSRGAGDAAIAHKITVQLRHSKTIVLVPVTDALAERAATIAADCRIRGCDAVYVALAAQLGETLVTLDRQQLERGSAVITAISPYS